MTLIEIYDELEEKGIMHYSGRYGFDGDADAATIEARSRYAIFFDVLSLRTERQEIAAAVHELSHIEAGAMLHVNASPWEAYKAEKKAERHEIARRIPFDELKEATQSGRCANAYEIAEHFGVSEDMAKMAIEHYHKRGERW